MNRRALVLSFAVASAAMVGFLAPTAQSQLGVAKNYVQLQSSTPGAAQSGHATVTGTITANKFVGQGNSLTGLDASALSTGTVPDARLGANIPRLNALNVFSAENRFSAPVGIGVVSATAPLDVNGLFKLNGPSGSSAMTILANSSTNGVFIDNNGSGQGLRVEAQGQGISVLSNANVGVRAVSNVLNGIEGVGAFGGVRGDGSSFGVQGVANVNGVFGQGTTGVRGNGNSFGVFSEGNFGASGTKSFVIDHPFDPENQYLVHYSHEGPEPRNVYQGKVETDATGFAWVELPDYYDAINRDPLIQLTVIDESDDFVNVKVSKRLDKGRFQIRTSKPGVEVNWRVDAIRDDAWVRAKGAPVEKAKTDTERGRYLHPELYGEPSSKSITPLGK